MIPARATSFAGSSVPAANAWTWAAYGWALLVTLGLSYFLVRMPFQVSDNIGNLLQLHQKSLGDLLYTYSFGGTYLRPLLWGFMKVVFDVSHGHYFLAFKAVEIVQLFLLLSLFARLLMVRSRVDFLAAPFAFTVLLGIHTFGGFLWEAYPINTFMTIAVFVLAVLNLAESRGGLIVDAVAPVLLVAAMFMVESGLLVWVATAAAYLAGARGVSRRGLTASTAVFVGYFVLRFVVLGGGTPGLDERSTGYGFSVVDRFDLPGRFGENPSWFYFTNVVSAFASVLFAEPRYGVWEFSRALITDAHELAPWMIINVVTSTLTTLLIVGYTLRRVPKWLRLNVDPDDRLVVVFWALTLANAVISYAYCKDQIVSVAGVVYPLAAFGVVRHLLRRSPAFGFVVRTALVGILLLASAGWAVRTCGLCYTLHAAAYRHRNDWVDIEKWMHDARVGEHDPADAEFVRGIRRDALRMQVPPPVTVYGRFGSRYFDQHP